MNHLQKHWKTYSQVATFLLGASFAIHEVFVSEHADPAVLGFSGACLGLVGSWIIDIARNSKNGPTE